MLREEMKKHLTEDIIPFWKGLRDDDFGGYYGYMDYNLKLDKKAVKGCILNSRITWFFANAYMLLKDESLLSEARHAYEFLRDRCMDKVNGGIFWSMNYDGTPFDTTKHTYNQAFAIYALSSYYEATGDKEALEIAKSIYRVIEDKCTDEIGYKEAFDIHFEEVGNEKLSENGVEAKKTMNTWLHILEAYTEFYKVSKDPEVAQKLRFVLDTFYNKIYAPKRHRQEVFFDREMNSIIDLHSYGHDIEGSWLTDRACEVLADKGLTEKMRSMTNDLRAEIYRTAWNGESLHNECERGVVNDHRIWWVQAETVVGFINGWQKEGREEYLKAANAEWEFIKKYVIDKRAGSEWFWEVRPDGTPYEDRPIVEPWKCPYHNGRMCMEVMKRLEEK